MNRTASHVITGLFVVLGCLAFDTAVSSAQEMSGTVGLSASWQTSQQGISVPIWLSEEIVLAPAFNVTKVSDQGTDFGVGVLLRFNLRRDKVVPYLGVRVLKFIYNPEVGDTVSDTVLGGVFGGEYFVGEGLSVSVEAQVNYATSDKNSLRFGNPDGTNLNTASAVMATVYF